ncbi:MAG: DHH family phosphoesterase [Phycisphaerae bacterium]
MSDPQLIAIARALKSAKSVAIFTHARPDPDAIGSQVGAGLMLSAMGKNISIVCLPPVPEPLEFLLDMLADSIVHFTASHAAAISCDRILVVDTSARQQLEPAVSFLESHSDRVLILDHHISGDLSHALLYRDTSAAACVQMVTELGAVLGVTLTKAMATALLAGLVGDTGWFRFDSVTPRTHEVAAQLLAAGASPSELWNRLMQSERKSKLTLLSRAVGRITFFAQDRIAVMELSHADIAQAQAQAWETEGLIDIPMMVGSVVVSIFLSETPEGRIRASLRSKHTVDVNAVSHEFDGGGHARAAGCRLTGPLESARKALVAAVTRKLP